MRNWPACALDIEASLKAIGQRLHVSQFEGLEMLKFASDLARLSIAINRARPEVIVETGTYTGASALWMATHLGIQQVITVDVDPNAGEGLRRHARGAAVSVVAGRSSVDDSVVAQVVSLVDGRRCMVVLDSLHTAAHVAAEIQAYGPLVAPGSMLVVEDGLFDFASPEQLTAWSMPELIHGGGPLVAIDERLVGNPDWTRAVDIESDPYLPPLSQCPAGWWVRNG